jgi:hypothetical protein
MINTRNNGLGKVLSETDLAGIFYTFVRNFGDSLVESAINQTRYGQTPLYKEQLKQIRDWAQRRNYESIESSANLRLEDIDQKIRRYFGRN